MQNHITAEPSLALEEKNENFLIYYFSKFKFLSDNILNDLLFCKTFRVSVVQLLSITYLQNQSALMERKCPTCSLRNRDFRKEVCQSAFHDRYVRFFMDDPNQHHSTPVVERSKHTNICGDCQRTTQIIRFEDLLISLIECFYLIAQELSIGIVRSQDPNNQFFIQKEIQPLLVMKERTRSAQREEVGSRKRVKKRSTISSSQDEFEPQFLMDLVSKLTLEDEYEMPESERSQSDMRDCDPVNIKARKFTKQQEKLQQSQIFQNLQEPDEKIKMLWSVAKQHVVCIWQIPLENSDSLNRESVRFIQPSELFYKQLLQLWMLEKCSSQRRIQFNQFVYKAKHFFGTAWKDTYLIPSFVVFQSIEQALQSVPSAAKTQVEVFKHRKLIQILKHILYDLVDKHKKLWNQNIILNAQKIKKNT